MVSYKSLRKQAAGESLLHEVRAAPMRMPNILRKRPRSGRVASRCCLVFVSAAAPGVG